MDPITIAAIGMQNDLLRLNSISQNLANVMTPGYKRQINVIRPFDSFVEGAMGAPAAAAEFISVSQHSTLIDPSAGTLRYTGNPLDIAIEGSGFFEIRTDSGVAYTRQGALRTDAQGRLVTGQGFPVIGLAGEVTANGGSVVVERNGEVKQGERVLGQIKLVHFANPEALAPLGNGLFNQGAARLGEQNLSSALRAGFQENANVSAPQERVRLSETVRHFESMQKVIQGYDDVLEKAIRKLGEF